MPKRLYACLLTLLLARIVPAAWAYDGYDTTPMMNPSTPAQTSTSTRETSSKTGNAESYGTTVAKKLGAGLSNLALGFLEIPKNVINTTNEANLALGVTGGMAKGVLHAAGRTLSGLADTLTFPLPTEPIVTPQFVWENYTVETRYNRVFKMKP